MKTKFLAVYDYGTGGVWAVVAAESKDEIVEKYPVLTIFDERPSWMTAEDYGSIVATASFDIEDEPPMWLVTAMRESQKT